MKLKKGSAAARAYMAKIRAMRGAKSKPRKIRVKRSARTVRLTNPSRYFLRLPAFYSSAAEAMQAGQKIADRYGIRLQIDYDSRGK